MQEVEGYNPRFLSIILWEEKADHLQKREYISYYFESHKNTLKQRTLTSTLSISARLRLSLTCASFWPTTNTFRRSPSESTASEARLAPVLGVEDEPAEEDEVGGVEGRMEVAVCD